MIPWGMVAFIQEPLRAWLTRLESMIGDGVETAYKENDFVALASDQSTTSTTYVDVPGMSLTVNVSTGDELLITVTGSGSVSASGTTGSLQLLVDGVAVASCPSSTVTNPFPVAWAMVWRASGLGAGAREVKLRWKTSANTTRCRPLTQEENMALLVERVDA